MNNKNRYVDNFLIGWQTKGRLKNEKRYANVSSSTLVNSLSIVFTSFYGIVLLPFSLEKWFQEFPFWWVIFIISFLSVANALRSFVRTEFYKLFVSCLFRQWRSLWTVPPRAVRCNFKPIWMSEEENKSFVPVQNHNFTFMMRSNFYAQ